MSTSYLLDSSVLVLSLKKDLAIRQHLANATALYISAVALGELYYGAEHSTQVKRNSAEVDELAQAITILTCDHATARIYGHFKHEQSAKGLILPDNDLWIAATAIQYRLTLAARDRHFM
jgi:predicted nucleic acid-binding protein